MKSAWVVFPRLDRITCSLPNPISTPATPISAGDGVKKGVVKFLLNTLRLGEFTAEHRVKEQEGAIARYMRPITIPKGFLQAMRSVDSAEWQAAITTEVNNMRTMEVFDILPLPPQQHATQGGWAFAIKGIPGVDLRYKASSLWLLLMIAAHEFWEVTNFDFVAAYLNPPISKELWIKPPEGMEIPKGYGCRLQKELYGTRQAGRHWWKHLSGTLCGMGYDHSAYNLSVYVNHGAGVYIWVHVDDGIVFARTPAALADLRHHLSQDFRIKWADGVRSIIGLRIDHTANGYLVSQTQAIDGIIASHGADANVKSSPLSPSCQLPTLNDNHTPVEPKRFLLVIGLLIHISSSSRPDICFAVNSLACHQKNPGDVHWRAVQHLLGYLKGWWLHGLILEPTNDQGLCTYLDESWGGEFRRSCHGYITTMYSCPISWASKRLFMVAASSCHAEYMALSLATRHALWKQLLLENLALTKLVVKLHCDNASCIKICRDSGSSKQTRHSTCDFYITNQALFENKASLEWVPS
ncbi:hypothetical protein O181_031129 [Austropuccinia psidii MF-1]|uniref:Reverse transcriptase Ty1/copia-type domain-containing protein n=1 Tax=Austropuccinia psidii MF-1 TaxID=1389203 RepID=A0A9Q3CU87_9BASI|nr:hypothetical protein [Austropuccinia psidii MF-1]